MSFPRIFITALAFLMLATQAQALKLTWGHDGVGLDGFKLHRKVGNQAYAELATLAKDAREHTDSITAPATGATAVCYIAYAYNVEGLSDPSNEACTTLVPRPKAPTGLKITP